MSATINIEGFSEYFNNAPIIQVPGRLYPVDVEYCPYNDLILNNNTDISSNNNNKSNYYTSPYLSLLQRIDKEYPSYERGDVLIFLSGLQEINYVANSLKDV